MLSQYQSSAQEVHVEAMYLIFHLLYNNPNNILVMDSSMAYVDGYVFNLNADWKELYFGVVEKYPHQILELLGRPVYFGCFINVYHGGNVITRRLHS